MFDLPLCTVPRSSPSLSCWVISFVHLGKSSLLSNLQHPLNDVISATLRFATVSQNGWNIMIHVRSVGEASPIICIIRWISRWTPWSWSVSTRAPRKVNPWILCVIGLEVSMISRSITSPIVAVSRFHVPMNVRTMRLGHAVTFSNTSMNVVWLPLSVWTMKFVPGMEIAMISTHIFSNVMMELWWCVHLETMMRKVDVQRIGKEWKKELMSSIIVNGKDIAVSSITFIIIVRYYHLSLRFIWRFYATTIIPADNMLNHHIITYAVAIYHRHIISSSSPSPWRPIITYADLSLRHYSASSNIIHSVLCAMPLFAQWISKLQYNKTNQRSWLVIHLLAEWVSQLLDTK